MRNAIRNPRRTAPLLAALVAPLLGCPSTRAPVRPDRRAGPTDSGIAEAAGLAPAKAPEPPKPPPPPPETPLSEKIARAKALFVARDFAGARKAYAAVLEKDPKNAEALFHTATAYEADGDLDRAADFYRRTIENQPDHEGALLNLGRLYRNREQFDEAVAMYVKALEAVPDNVRVRNNLGVVYRLAHKYDDAEKTLRRVLARAPGNVDAYKNMAVLFLDQNKLDLAEQFSVEAKKLDDKDSGIYNNLGLLYFKKDQGRPSRALAAFKKAVELNPNDATAWRNLGSIALRYRDYVSAEKSLAKSAELDPNSLDAHLAYAFALEGGKKFKEAMGEYGRVMELRPGYAEAIYGTANCLRNLREWEKARDLLKEYVAMPDAVHKDDARNALAGCEAMIKAAQQAPPPAPTPMPDRGIGAPAPAPEAAPAPAPAPAPEPAPAPTAAPTPVPVIDAPAVAVHPEPGRGTPAPEAVPAPAPAAPTPEPAPKSPAPETPKAAAPAPEPAAVAPATPEAGKEGLPALEPVPIDSGAAPEASKP